MSLRRLFVSLLLIVGLLLTQQAAMLHEIGHFGAANVVDATGGESFRTGDAARAFCEKCLAFAQVVNAVDSAPFLLDVVSERLAEITRCAPCSVGRVALPARSRGPPRFL